VAHAVELRSRRRLDELAKEVLGLGRRLIIYFFGFAIGYLIIELIPEEWIVSWLGVTRFFQLSLPPRLVSPSTSLRRPRFH
jgi:uncharacterized membrane protein YraQ (UPF0718 family)